VFPPKHHALLTPLSTHKCDTISRTFAWICWREWPLRREQGWGLVHTGRCTAHSNTRRKRGNTHTQVTRTNKAGVAQAILASRLAKAKDCAGAQPLGHTCRACTIRNLRTYTEVCDPAHFSPLRTLAKQFSDLYTGNAQPRAKSHYPKHNPEDNRASRAGKARPCSVCLASPRISLPLRASGLGQTGTPSEPALPCPLGHAFGWDIRRWPFTASVKENCYV